MKLHRSNERKSIFLLFKKSFFFLFFFIKWRQFNALCWSTVPFSITFIIYAVKQSQIFQYSKECLSSFNKRTEGEQREWRKVKRRGLKAFKFSQLILIRYIVSFISYHKFHMFPCSELSHQTYVPSADENRNRPSARCCENVLNRFLDHSELHIQ